MVGAQSPVKGWSFVGDAFKAFSVNSSGLGVDDSIFDPSGASVVPLEEFL